MENVLSWDLLGRQDRLRIIAATSLPTSLWSANWAQLTGDERKALSRVNWLKAMMA